MVYKIGSHDLKYIDQSGLTNYLFEGSAYLDRSSTA